MAEHPVLRAYLVALQQQIVSLQAQVHALQEEVKALRDRFDLDSQNSHTPPSSDKGRSTKSLRTPSERSPGAQEGHTGAPLAFRETPDHRTRHELSRCDQCGADVSQAPVDQILRRQVYELPPLALEVTEHQAEVKVGPSCHATLQAPFPEGVAQKTQYGPRVKGLLVYVNNYQRVPYQRLGELFYDLFSQPISAGLISTANQRASDQLGATSEEIKAALSSADVTHFDETGLYEQGQRIW